MAEDLIAERGTAVSYQAVKAWASKFGSQFANRIGQRSSVKFADK